MKIKIKTNNWFETSKLINANIVLEAIDGIPPYRWAVIDGELPLGLNLDNKTGVIKGIPKRKGVFRYQILVRDSKNETARKSFGLVVKEKVNMLYTWGLNNEGQLGDNTCFNKYIPTPIFNKVKCLSYGNAHGALIKNNGSLWTWGHNITGQLGDNTNKKKSSPVQNIAAGYDWKKVSCGSRHVAAIKKDGTLWLWGYNGSGALGNNKSKTNNPHESQYANSQSSPIQTIAGGNKWMEIACGGETTAAIKKDGSLWMWGNNFFANLGDDTRISRSSPVQTIAGGNDWLQVSVSLRTTGAIKKDGSLWMWGQNNFGQLGDNTTIDKSSPVQTIAGGNNWKYISVGNNYSAAIKTDGSLWMWGKNQIGTLGDGSAINKSSPVQVISNGSKWEKVSCGYMHTLGLKEDNTLWSWGSNNEGQLGHTKKIDLSKNIPIKIEGKWKDFDCRENNSGAISKLIK